ncbi:MAG: cytochrome-c peroxidase [Anaerolineae bacterium]|nr:cytochrome-c peroxidase [Phycisphaerae bacterium]
MVSLFVGSVLVARGFDEPAVTPSTRPTTQPTTRSAEAAARRVRRAELTDEQYKTLADDLRKTYSKPVEHWPKPLLDPGELDHFTDIGPLPPPPFPDNNPFTKEKETLGRQLFFDPRLSGSGQIACASCHDPDLAWADGRTTSFGHDRMQLRRNAPSVLFSAYMKTQFWDGRSGSLEDQVRSPISSHDEMASNPSSVEKRLNTIPEYREQFKQIFGADRITMLDASKAVATFERALAMRAGKSKFDKFATGDADALSDAAVRGLHLFRTEARCINCHYTPAFTDNEFHNVGLTYYGRELEDLGRYVVTDDPQDVGKFRTPTLRNVGRTRPYMHNGVFDLEGLIAVYNNGMPVPRPTKEQETDPLFPKTDPMLQPLHLNLQDRQDLQAFLESLNEPFYRMRPPRLPPEAPKKDDVKEDPK